MQVVWKLKHIPSGEYATASNSKFNEYTTIHLTVLGKVFLRKPKVPNVPVKWWGHAQDRGKAEVSDWVLEEYRLELI